MALRAERREASADLHNRSQQAFAPTRSAAFHSTNRERPARRAASSSHRHLQSTLRTPPYAPRAHMNLARRPVTFRFGPRRLPRPFSPGFPAILRRYPSAHGRTHARGRKPITGVTAGPMVKASKDPPRQTGGALSLDACVCLDEISGRATSLNLQHDRARDSGYRVNDCVRW